MKSEVDLNPVALIYNSTGLLTFKLLPSNRGALEYLSGIHQQKIYLAKTRCSIYNRARPKTVGDSNRKNAMVQSNPEQHAATAYSCLSFVRMVIISKIKVKFL